jgi:hypothetical protein
VGPFLELALLGAAGLFAGFVNSIAGAGSLLTLPALVFTGLDAGAANATNRVAVIFQTVAAAVAFRRGGVAGSGRLVLALFVPAAACAAAGSFVATSLSDRALRLCIAIAMMVFLALSLVPRRNAAPADQSPGAPEVRSAPPVTLGLVAGFAAIGFYAGFLQAGVGILVLLYLALVYRVPLVVGNGVKVLFILAMNLVAVAVFLVRGAGVEPLRGLVLAFTSSLGAYVGARTALHGGERVVRAAMVVAVLASMAKLLWDAS